MASFPPNEDVDDDFLEQILSMPFCGVGGRVCGSEHPFLREEPGQGNRCVEHEGGGIERPLAAAAAAARSTSSAEAVTDVAVACRVPRQKVRAKRGQATNPHSIAERIRREKITEKIKALQELVPSCNKTDRAVMLDELLDYVKFLRLQVKVLSLSRIGGAGAFSQLVADTSLQQMKGEGSEEENKLQSLERWSTSDGLEQQVAELLQEDIGAALQFLQSKSLCIVPISLAAFISQVTDQSGAPSTVMPDYAPS